MTMPKPLPSNPLKRLGVGLAVAAATVVNSFAADCDAVAASVSKKVEAEPEKVLMIVEDAMSTHDKCACEIVKSAIVASRASGRLVGEIVFTAVISSESMAPTVAECAISVAPDSASQIRSALKRALSDAGDSAPVSYGKNPVSGKNAYGKDTVPSADPVDEGGFDFGRAPLDVRGIYLLAPSPGGTSVIERDSDVPRKLAKRFKRIFGFFPEGLDPKEIIRLIERESQSNGEVIIVRRPVTPANPDFPTPEPPNPNPEPPNPD